MILHLGGGYFIDTARIIGIFDMENTDPESATAGFLKWEEQKGNIIDATSSKIPKSFVITDEGVYICEMSAGTLEKRLKSKKNGSIEFQ